MLRLALVAAVLAPLAAVPADAQRTRRTSPRATTTRAAAVRPTPPPTVASDGTLRVAYTMDVRMDAPQTTFSGTQRLVLTNDSPDTLRHVFYHLYFNAFDQRSQMAERNRHLPDPDRRVVPKIFNYTPEQTGYHRVQRLTQNGTPLTFEVYDTMLKATLARPIPPGGTATFDMAFNSRVPLQTRRSGANSAEGIDFSMTQWYPKLAMYDARGWHADPYIGREFYAPFGTFNVNITIPDAYTLGASGVLQNPNEIGKGYESRGARVAPATNGMRTWRFRAENVHDFAWVADRDYIHEAHDGPGGVKVHLLYQPDAAPGYASQAELMRNILSYFGERVGPYAWPQMTVAQGGDGGMEYPMITLITGGRQAGQLRGVTIHETAHMWFYGMLGSNESDYAWMDEGFTEFITTALENRLDGKPEDHRAATQTIVQYLGMPGAVPLSTPSDHFPTNRFYSVSAYMGGEMILEQLGLVLGDEVRDRGLRRYYREYRFRHPQPADIERVMEEESGVQLDWFFWQLTQTTRRMDYAVDSVGTTNGQSTVRLKRVGDLFFPLDVRLTMTDGSTRMVTIPTGEMFGAKAVPTSWTVAPAWGWPHPTYTLNVPGTVTKVEIDPDGRSLDYDRSNNVR